MKSLSFGQRDQIAENRIKSRTVSGGSAAMPDLKSDFVGRVSRLPLRPTDRNALVPVMEAVSNSIFAITERFEDQAGRRGRVDLTIVRDLEDDFEPIIGFDIEDNGIGFTEENYQSFLTPDSRLKERKGGKGVGRLAWLKVFEHIDIQSTFSDGHSLHTRHFRFKLAEHDQVEEISLQSAPAGAAIGTRVEFRGFDSRFASRCPEKPGIIALRVLSHFVPLFIAGNAPKVIIHDGDSVDIEALFGESIEDQRTDIAMLELNGEQSTISIWSLKCKKTVRFDGGGFNFGFITGNSRSVIEYSLDDQLGLHLLDDQFIYLGAASSDYLDEHVNAERTGFTLDPREIDEIKRTVAKHARNFLETYIEISLAEKARITHELIIDNPQFLYVEPDIKGFVEGIQPNVSKKEDIFVELSRNRFRRQRTFRNIEKDIIKSEVIDAALEAKIQEYREFLTAEKKGALAEYVTRRKAVLDLFEKFLEYREANGEQYQNEDAIHKLICPMHVDLNGLTIDDHNLWILDDRLAFFHFFASDKRASSYAGVEGLERPDLAFFFDSCVAWREGENTDTIVLVEFKKPMRNDYTTGKDPVQQILSYVELLRTETSVPDIRGRAIRGITSGTQFHCYIVADITPTLQASIIGRFVHTPDGQGYFGYSLDPPAFIEILPYGKILRDAKTRNVIFFRTLGITSEG